MFDYSLSPQKVFGSVVAVLVVLLFSTYISFRRFADLRNAEQWDAHSYQVLIETGNISRALLDMQTGARWYLKTGNTAFYNKYQNGLTKYKSGYATVLQMTSDNPDQQKAFARLSDQFADWNDQSTGPLVAMRRAATDGAAASLRADESALARQAKFTALTSTLDGVSATENKLLQERDSNEGHAQDVAIGALTINGIFAVVLATGLAIMLTYGARRMNLLNERLRVQRDRLERAERDAKLLSNHNEMLLSAAYDGIAGMNLGGRTTFFNPAAEKITGYKAEEVIGKLQHALLHGKRADGSEYPPAECPIVATIRDGRVHRSRNEVFWHKDGHPIEIEFTSAPMFVARSDDPYAEAEDNGQQVGAVIMFRDIGDQKRAENAQRELAAIVQYSEDSIVSVSLGGIVTRWNDAATKLYGYTENEMVGHRIQRLLPDDSVDDIAARLEKIQAGERVDRYEAARRRQDGTLVNVIVGISPVFDENGQVVGVSSISRQVFRDRVQRPIGSQSGQEQTTQTGSATEGHSADGGDQVGPTEKVATAVSKDGSSSTAA